MTWTQTLCTWSRPAVWLTRCLTLPDNRQIREKLGISLGFLIGAIYVYLFFQAVAWLAGRCTYSGCHGFAVVKPLQMVITDVAVDTCCFKAGGFACREFPCKKYAIQATLAHGQTCNFYYQPGKSVSAEFLSNFTVNAVYNKEYRLLKEKHSNNCLDNFASDYGWDQFFQSIIFWITVLVLFVSVGHLFEAVVLACRILLQPDDRRRDLEGGGVATTQLHLQ